MHKKLTAIVSLVCLFSCAPIIPLIPAENGKIIENFPSNKMALVVFKISTPGPYSKWFRIDNKFSPYLGPIFYNSYHSGSSGHDLLIYSDPNYQVLMLRPGIYSLDTIFVSHSSYIIPKWGYGAWNQKDKEPFLVAFEALPETITYIGDIQIFSKAIFSDRVLPYKSVQDNFEAAKSFFRDKYPEIRSDFVRKLAFGKSPKNQENDQ